MTEDGSIVINTKIRTDGIKAGSQEIEAGLRRAADRVNNLGASAKNAINKQIDAFAKLNNEYSAQEQKVESLRQKVASYANQRIPTEEYKKIQDEIETTTEKMNQLIKAQEWFVSNGGDINSNIYRNQQRSVDEWANSIGNAKKKLDDLEKSGKAFKEIKSVEAPQAEIEKLAVAERRLADMQNRLNTSYSGIKSKLASYGTGLVSLKEKLFGVNSANNKTANSNSKLSRSFKGASKSAGSARMSIGRMLTMSLLFSGAFRILSALTQGIIGGFNNLAQYSKATNANISTLWGSLIRLQNAFATAFSPILTVITPILSRFIDLISTAITYVGMFFGYLAGNKTYTKALAVQKDYAASLDKTAKSTKKATKAAKDYLSPLDEINRYTTNKDTDTTPSGSDVNGTPISKMFEEVPIDAPPIFEKIKDVLGQIFQPFKEAWEREGKNTIDAAKYALSELGALAKSVGSSMLEVWTNGTGTQILSTMLQIAQGLLTTIGNIARQLDIAWNKNAVGTAIIQAIADAFQKVLDIINRLVWDTAQWAGSLNFYPLLDSIKNLFESMSPLIEAIGSFLERLYVNAILPMLTWLIETGLPTLLNVLASVFDFLGEHQWIVDAIGAALLGAFASSKISPLVLGIRGTIMKLIEAFTGAGGLSGAISVIVTAFGKFATASHIIPIAIALAVAAIVLIITHWDQLKAVMSKLIDWIKGVFATDWHAQFGVLGDVVEVFLNSFKGIFNSIKQICSGFVTFLKGVFSGNVNMALKGILNILRGAANLIYSIFKAPVNMVIALFNGLNQAIINAINGLVDGLNHIKVPDWVPGIGGKGINLSHANYTRIPYLAQGAVIPAGNPFLAVLGDQTKGNNLEMPENLLRKIVSEESGKGTGMIKLVVNLDSRTVLEQLINTAKEMQMSNGQNVFELGR
nr:MAG TPA: minor tail protein [Bacteriophage sp.]